MWFGLHAGGVACFDGANWQRLSPDGWPGSSFVQDVVVDPAGRVWVGSNGYGLACYDGRGWRTWTTRDNLAGYRITDLAVDLDGSIWVGTQSGVSHIVLKEPQ